jgi:hypothetical protein
MIEVIGISIFLATVAGLYLKKTKEAKYKVALISNGQVKEILFEREGTEEQYDKDEEWVYDYARSGNLQTEHEFLAIVNMQEEIIYQVRINKNEF